MEKEEVGWYAIGLTDKGREDALFRNTEKTLNVFQWHQDSFELPEGAVLLATSVTCKNQAFRIKRNAYGLQFHIEVTPGIVESWIDEYLENSDKNKLIFAQKMLIDTYKNRRTYRDQAMNILLNFSRLIDKRTLVQGGCEYEKSF